MPLLHSKPWCMVQDGVCHMWGGTSQQAGKSGTSRLTASSLRLASSAAACLSDSFRCRNW